MVIKLELLSVWTEAQSLYRLGTAWAGVPSCPDYPACPDCPVLHPKAPSELYTQPAQRTLLQREKFTLFIPSSVTLDPLKFKAKKKKKLSMLRLLIVLILNLTLKIHLAYMLPQLSLCLTQGLLFLWFLL